MSDGVRTLFSNPLSWIHDLEEANTLCTLRAGPHASNLCKLEHKALHTKLQPLNRQKPNPGFMDPPKQVVSAFKRPRTVDEVGETPIKAVVQIGAEVGHASKDLLSTIILMCRL